MILSDTIEKYNEFKIKHVETLFYQQGGFGGLYDVESKRVMYFSNYIFTLRCFSDKGYQIILNITENSETRPNLMNDFWTYVFDKNERKLIYDPQKLELSQLEKLSLDNEKAFALEYILTRVNHWHYLTMRGEFKYQADIYKLKAEQAKLVLDGCLDYEKTYLVHSWSEISGKDLILAAKNILFKHENQNIYLHNVEHLRLQYTNYIIQAIDKPSILETLKKFDTESFINAYV